MLTRRSVLSTASLLPAWAQQRRPNIVFILSDDHHFQGLGVSGNPHIHTPNLDRLAKNGVHFTNAIISTSQCCPSRGILLSGQETYQSGLLSNGQMDFQRPVQPAVMERLRTAGYETIHIGKWHITPTPASVGFARSPLWLRGGGSKYQDPALRRGQDGKDETVKGHITDLLTDAGIEAIKSAKQPFFLWMAYNAPHTPWYAAEKYRAPYAGKSNESLAPPLHPPGGGKFDWATYYAVITHLDEAVGRLVRSLEGAGQLDNTVIFFLGDNGYMANTRNWTGKVRHWDESVRVPFFAAGAGVKKGVRVEDPVASIDLTSTWLELAGTKATKPMSGRSITSYLKTGSGNIDAAFSAWDDPRAEGLTAGVEIEPYRLVRTKTHKLVVFASKKQALYDCVADVSENVNLIDDAKHAKLRDQLRRKLRARMQETGDHAISWL